MNLKNALYFAVSLLLTGGIALAQQATPAPAPAPPEPPDFPGAFSFFVGGSFIGVYAEDISRENMARYGLSEPRGVGITEVMKDSPAEKAGLRKDDVILRFENDTVTSSRKLSRLVSEVAPDQTVRLGISRGGAEQEVSVTVGKRENAMGNMRLQGLDKLKDFKDMEKAFPPGANVWKWEGDGPGRDGMVFAFGDRRRIGVTTVTLTKQLADYFGIADGQGVLVSSVSDDSPAARAGIKAGDVIISADGEKVASAGDLARAINKKKDGEVTLSVVRNRNQRTINVTPKEQPMPAPGATPGTRTIVVPRVEMGSIPEMNIQVPRIDLPSIPEINVVVPKSVKVPKVRVINMDGQPI